MSEKKQLNQEELDKVTGGVTIGNYRIVECEACKNQFDPDTTQRGPNEINTSENGEYGYVTFKCPYCNEFHRVKYIQVKYEDIKTNGVIYFAE